MLIHPDEDGNIVSWIESEELKDIKQFMEDYGIEKFLDGFAVKTDPQYWGEGKAMLLEYEIKKVKPIVVVEKYEIE